MICKPHILRWYSRIWMWILLWIKLLCHHASKPQLLSQFRQKTGVTSLNEYHPVALAPHHNEVIWKTQDHVRAVLPPSLSPLQLAYSSNRSIWGLQSHCTPSEPRAPRRTRRMLFVDFNLAQHHNNPPVLYGREAVTHWPPFHRAMVLHRGNKIWVGNWNQCGALPVWNHYACF